MAKWFEFNDKDDYEKNIIEFKIIYPNKKLPKFKLGQKVLLKDDYIDLHIKYINYPYSPAQLVNFEPYKDDEIPLIINEISYNIDSDIIYYCFENIGEYLGEPSIKMVTPKYNEPKKLVYEEFEYNNIDDHESVYYFEDDDSEEQDEEVYIDTKWFFCYNNEELKEFKNLYPDSKLPKFKIGDEVSLVNDFRKKNNEYINYGEENVNYRSFEKIKSENGILKIKSIAYNIKSNIVYYDFIGVYGFLGEVTLTKKGGFINYNEPKKLVYEKIMSFKKYNDK